MEFRSVGILPMEFLKTYPLIEATDELESLRSRARRRLEDMALRPLPTAFAEFRLWF